MTAGPHERGKKGKQKKVAGTIFSFRENYISKTEKG
jgi:hypothetical protein